MANCVLKLREIGRFPLLLRSSLTQYCIPLRHQCSVSVLEKEQKLAKVKTNLEQRSSPAKRTALNSQGDIYNSYPNLDMNYLEAQINRNNRIFSEKFLKMFDKLLKSNDRENFSRYCLFLIRCCGNVMLDLTEKEKIYFAHSVWKKFEKRGTRFDISHYNALLKVYTENHHMFNHERLLSNLKLKNIQPNSTTYQRMIADCCSRGEIKEAKILMSKMKELGMPPNENVFQSLIIGYAKASNIETALLIPTEMRELGLMPGADTYQTIMTALAETGNVDRIMEIKTKMEQEGLNADEPLLKIIESLAMDEKNRHFCHQVFPILERSEHERLGLFASSVAHTVQYLCYKGCFDIAFQVASLCDYSSKPTTLLINCIFADGSPQCSEEIAREYLDRIGSEYPLVYITALNKMILSKQYFHSGLIEQTLEKITVNGLVLNDSTLYEIVRRCIHMNDLKLAKKLVNLVGHEKKLSFARFFLIPIREFILKSGHIMDAVEMLEEIFPIIEIDSKKALSLLVYEIVSYFKNQYEVNSSSAMLASKLFTIFIDRGMKIECSPSLLNLMNSSFLSFNSMMLMTMLMQPEDVKQLIEKQEKKNAPQSKYNKMNMLTILSCIYGFNGNYTEAVKIKEDILPANDKLGNFLSKISTISLINALILQGNFDEAIELSKQMKSELKILFTVYTRCTEVLAKTGKLPEALEFVKKIKGSYPQFLLRMPFPRVSLWPYRIQRLMDQGFASEAEAILDTLMEAGYPAENYTCSVITHSYLKRNNIEAAVIYLEKVYKHYKILPSVMEIFKESLKVRDRMPELFERAFNCCQSVYDSNYLKHKLAFALLEIGYIEEAKECLKFQSVQKSFLQDKLEVYALSDNLKCIQNTINMIKSAYNPDWDYIYFTLIKAYGKKNNWKRCLELWQQMQKEKILPRNRTLNFLAGILENNNQPVPFYVPFMKTVL